MYTNGENSIFPIARIVIIQKFHPYTHNVVSSV